MTICHNCKRDNKEEAKFCIDCGNKLKVEENLKLSNKKEHIEKHDAESKSKKPYKWIWIERGLWIILAVLVIVIMIGIFTARLGTFQIGTSKSNSISIPQSPSNNVGPRCRNTQVPYETQEEYMKTEYYTEYVPYTDRECESKELTYKVVGGTCQGRKSGLFGLGDQPAKYSCIITNLDSEGGSFSVRIGFNVGNQKLETTQVEFVYPQSSNTFSYEVDASIDSCYCTEKAPTKQVCRDVTKYKEVQRERQVTSYRPVTKYRTEQTCD